jgi:hypothetical protein
MKTSKKLVGILIVFIVLGIAAAIASRRLLTEALPNEQTITFTISMANNQSAVVLINNQHVGTTPVALTFAQLKEMFQPDLAPAAWPPPNYHGVSHRARSTYSFDVGVVTSTDKSTRDDLLLVRHTLPIEPLIGAARLRVVASNGTVAQYAGSECAYKYSPFEASVAFQLRFDPTKK